MNNWRFVHITDMHVGSPRSFRYQPAYFENWRTARDQITELAPEVVLVGGDLTRDGNIHDFEMERMREELKALPGEVRVIPGNMDTGNKRAVRDGAIDVPGREADTQLNLTQQSIERFTSFFGPPYWTFRHRNVRFSGFYAALAGSGIEQEALFWRWLEGLPDGVPGEQHVIMTHYPLFLEEPDEETFDLSERAQYLAWYFGLDKAQRTRILTALKRAGATIVVSGHIHCRKVQECDGIRFFRGPSTAFSQWPDYGDPTLGFQAFEVSNDAIEYRFEPLASISKAEGYGAGGHVAPHARDYSQAWERD